MDGLAKSALKIPIRPQGIARTSIVSIAMKRGWRPIRPPTFPGRQTFSPPFTGFFPTEIHHGLLALPTRLRLSYTIVARGGSNLLDPFSY